MFAYLVAIFAARYLAANTAPIAPPTATIPAPANTAAAMAVFSLNQLDPEVVPSLFVFSELEEPPDAGSVAVFPPAFDDPPEPGSAVLPCVPEPVPESVIPLCALVPVPESAVVPYVPEPIPESVVPLCVPAPDPESVVPLCVPVPVPETVVPLCVPDTESVAVTCVPEPVP